MNKEEIKAMLLYWDLALYSIDISVAECLACIDEDAKDLGLTRSQYLDYVIVNGNLPKQQY